MSTAVTNDLIEYLSEPEETDPSPNRNRWMPIARRAPSGAIAVKIEGHGSHAAKHNANRFAIISVGDRIKVICDRVSALETMTRVARMGYVGTSVFALKETGLALWPVDPPCAFSGTVQFHSEPAPDLARFLMASAPAVAPEPPIRRSDLLTLARAAATRRANFVETPENVDTWAEALSCGVADRTD